jgi:ribose 5-phosphate isomerase A
MATSRPAGPSAPLSEDPDVVSQKRAAASAAADMLRDHMCVGLGTGTTVAQLLPLIAERGLAGLRYAATSPQTEHAARALGLDVRPLDELGELDVAIDGADQFDPEGWLIKGGGGAHTREKIVAGAARCFVVICSSEKAVERLSPPVPLELLRFGVHHTLARLGPARLRADSPESPDGGLIADYDGPIGDPRELATRLSQTAGVVEHGLFPPELVSVIVVARGSGVELRRGAKPLERTVCSASFSSSA